MTDTISDRAAFLAFTDGYPVFPLTIEKRPACAHGFRDATTDPETIATLFNRSGAALIGVPTGSTGFDVLDIDPRKGGDEWLRANEHRLPATVRHHTRSGGVHLLFRHAPGMQSRADVFAPGVDTRAEGGYVVWWPSEGMFRSGDTIAEWPEWLLIEATRRTGPPKPPLDPDELAPPDAGTLVKLLRTLPNPADTDRTTYISVCLAVQGCIRGLQGRPDGCEPEDAEEIMDAAAEWAARWQSPNASDFESERRKWSDDWSQRTEDLSGWRHVLQHAQRLGVDVSGHRAAFAASEFAGGAPAVAVEAQADPYWANKLETKSGTPLANVRNILLALRTSPEWFGLLQYDDFAAKGVFTRCPPFPRERGTGGRPVHETDFALAAEWLQSQGIDASEERCKSAMQVVAWENRSEPLKTWLRSLSWDGVARIDTWLIDHLGAADTSLNRAFGAKFLISMVARGMQPGCQVDTMLVLMGRQGLRKSTALRALASSAWFADHLPDLSNKDAAMQLQGKWLVEHAEMATLRRTESNKAKAFISQPIDRFRPPFGKLTDDFPRQCVFAATVNPNGTGFLQDETGARRYWPVMCGVGWDPHRKVDTSAIADLRDQFFAEAVARFNAEESWWLDTPELEAAQAAAADAQYDEHGLTDRVLGIVSDRAVARVADILSALGLTAKDQLDRRHQMVVSGILTKAGWTRENRWIDGKTHRVYVNPLPVRSEFEESNVVDLAQFVS